MRGRLRTNRIAGWPVRRVLAGGSGAFDDSLSMWAVRTSGRGCRCRPSPQTAVHERSWAHIVTIAVLDVNADGRYICAPLGLEDTLHAASIDPRHYNRLLRVDPVGAGGHDIGGL
jgi:hypothetical protein